MLLGAYRLHSRARDLLIHYSYVWNDRKQFGQLVGDFQGLQHEIAQSYTEIAAARALVYNAARKKEAGDDFVKDAAMAKMYASQVAGRVSGLAVEWMGGTPLESCVCRQS